MRILYAILLTNLLFVSSLYAEPNLISIKYSETYLVANSTFKHGTEHYSAYKMLKNNSNGKTAFNYIEDGHLITKGNGTMFIYNKYNKVFRAIDSDSTAITLILLLNLKDATKEYVLPSDDILLYHQENGFDHSWCFGYGVSGSVRVDKYPSGLYSVKVQTLVKMQSVGADNEPITGEPFCKETVPLSFIAFSEIVDYNNIADKNGDVPYVQDVDSMMSDMNSLLNKYGSK